MPAQVTQTTVRTRDGLALAAWHHLPSEARARVVLLHGYAEHVGRYRHLIEALTSARYEVHSVDLRGHGRSEGVRGHVARFKDYLDDLDVFLAALPDGKLPRFIVAHSLGGLITLRYVLDRPQAFSALAVSSPFLQTTEDVPWVQEKVASATSLLAPTLLMKSPVDAKGLSHDPAIVQAYIDDPLVFKTINARWFFEVRVAQEEVLERAPEIRVPALFLVGGADPVAQPARSRQVFERLESPDKRLQTYDGFFHEVLNEIGKERVIRDLVAWLDER